MKSRLLLMVLVGVLLAPLSLRAQTGGSQPPVGETSGPTIDERMSSAESILARLERLGISGYVQARAGYIQDTTPLTNLYVRNARLAMRYTTDRSRMVLSFDGGQNTVTVKDAYVDLNFTRNQGQQQGLVLRSGQFYRPFGYEIERVESDREFPERPIGWNALFPGNRDQGFDLSLGVTPTTIVNAAIVNGNGSSLNALSFRDTDDHKDLMFRVRQTLFSPRLDMALSYYTGELTTPGTAAVAAQTGYVDENGNGVKDPGEPTVVISPAKAATNAITTDRDRWSVALNAYDVLGGTFRGEYVGAKDATPNLATGPSRVTADATAWFVQYVRYAAAGLWFGARYDSYDPDTDDVARPGDDGSVDTYALVGFRNFGDNVRFSLSWEYPKITIYDKTSMTSRETTNDVWTFQAQFRF